MLVRRPHLRAFTLVELVMVLAIIAVFSAIAFPRFTSSMVRYRVDSAAQRLAADLYHARQTAIATSQVVRIEFYIADDLYIIWGVRDIDFPDYTYAVAMDDPPYRIDIASANFGGSTVVQFDQYGRPSASGTVVVQIGTARRTVSLNQTTGKATVS
jgi:prepilin-type N-terminal cleavage/methylation domain-containing protein